MISGKLSLINFQLNYGNSYFMYNQNTKIIQFIVKNFTALEIKITSNKESDNTF